MKHLISFLIALTVLISSCKREGCTNPNAMNYDEKAKLDDGSCAIEPGCPSCPVLYNGEITSNETWTANHVYTLMGRVVVKSGVTLTIEPGTIIKAEEGTGSLAAMLIVESGGRINACGTAQQPIIFTSILDNIQPGEITGTNLTQDDRGLWGGLMLLGNAPVSTGDGDTVGFVEGGTITALWAEFGGSNPLDNSGNLCYISIRHSGALIGAGNEMGGLSLGGIGSGTNINNVEIVAGLDDGIDIIGGTVNIENAFVGFMGDDGIDLDQNYDGSISNFTIIDGSGDEAVEAEGPEGITYTDGIFELINGTILNFGGAESHSEFKHNAKGNITNVDFGGSIQLEANYDQNCVQLDTSCLKNLLDSPASLNFTNINRTSLNYRISPQTCSVSMADSTQAESLTQPSATAGNSNTNVQWTWLFANGFL